VALVFCPAHYLIDIKYRSDDILEALIALSVSRGHIGEGHVQETIVPEQDLRLLWKEWAYRFRPDFPPGLSVVASPDTIKDENIFEILLDDEEEQETV